MNAKEELEIIHARHVRTLDRHHHMVIAGLYLGWSVDEMADAWTCSTATVRRAIKKAYESVFDEMELEGTPELLRLWGSRHREHCTLAAWEMIENDQILGNW